MPVHRGAVAVLDDVSREGPQGLRQPRAARLPGEARRLARRAQAAHQNGWEALALFTAALVVAWHNGANVHRVDQLAMAFVAIRVVYMLMYLLNWASLRSLVWFGGMACVVALFFAAP